MNGTETARINIEHFQAVIYNSSVLCTVLAIIALFVNLYLLNCSRYLKRPIGVNLRLCVSLTASDAFAAFCYILTYTINVIFPSNISNCWSLLLEVIKLATFFASVCTLLILALNHYVGIVYPLRRHIITKRSVRITIILSYVVPFAVFFTLFSVVPGGFRANVAFGFFTPDGCASPQILQNAIVRSVIVVPFIVFTLAVSFLYCHIMVHMSRSTKDPLIAKSTNKPKYNVKLLGTLAMLAGSAVIGWLPTTILFALICRECVFPVKGPVVMYLTILSHLLNIMKLILDAFIYASRLIDIRFAIWQFHNSVLYSLAGIFNIDLSQREIPSEFAKYLSDAQRMNTTRRYRESSSIPPSCSQSKRWKLSMSKEKSNDTESNLESINPSAIFSRVSVDSNGKCSLTTKQV